MAGQEQMVSNFAEKDLDCILGKKSSLKGLLIIRTGFPGKWWNLCTWKSGKKCLGVVLRGMV